MAIASLALLTLCCASAPDFDDLPPISESVSPEVRVRVHHYWTGNVTGYVVRPGVVVVYERTRSGRDVRVVQTDVAYQILAMAERLAEFDGQLISCNLVDGYSLDIDAALDDRAFSFAANNPALCRLSGDAASQRVFEFEELLHLVAPTPAP